MVWHLHLNSSVSFANLVFSKPNSLPFPTPYHSGNIFPMKQRINASLPFILLVSCLPSGQPHETTPHYFCFFFLLHQVTCHWFHFFLLFLLLLLCSSPKLSSPPCRGAGLICIKTKHGSPSRPPFLLCTHPLLTLYFMLSILPKMNNVLTWFGAFGSVSLKHTSL